MGHLTTHVLDTANGCPAAGIRIELYRSGGEDRLISSTVTDKDGRCEAPMLEGADFIEGTYQLVFHAGEYFNTMGQQDGEHRFLNQVVIRFGVNDAQDHYHVPLLLSPFGYSTYRGS